MGESCCGSKGVSEAVDVMYPGGYSVDLITRGIAGHRFETACADFDAAIQAGRAYFDLRGMLPNR